MAIIHNSFLSYLSTTLTGSMDTRQAAYTCDPLFTILEICRDGSAELTSSPVSARETEKIIAIYHTNGDAGVIGYYFGRGL